MAITDNSFTPEEFGAAIAANPTLLDGVRNTLTASKYSVLSEQERADLLNNHESTVVANKTREYATNLEKDVLELTGIPKEANEKYYDYFKRATQAVKGDAAKYHTELEALRAKGGNTSEADKARMAALEKQLGETKADLEGKLTTAQKQLNDERATFAIEKALGSLRAKYKSDIPASLISIAEQSVLSDLLRRAKFQDSDGKQVLTFIGDDGQVMINKNTFKPMSAEDLLSDNAALKDLVDPGRKIAGTGTAGEQKGDPKGDGKFAGVPANVTTRVGLTEHLLSLGIMDGSEEFNKIMSEHGAKLKLR